MTQADANDRFQEALNRAKRLATDLTNHAASFDNGSDINSTDVDNFCSQLDDFETDIHSISDDAYVINDEGISDDDEDIEDEEYEDTKDLRPSDADKDEAEAIND